MKSIDEMTQEEILTELAELRRINAADGGVVDLRAQRRAEAMNTQCVTWFAVCDIAADEAWLADGAS